jgi:hypothetical protein
MTPPFLDDKKLKIVEYGENCSQKVDWGFFRRLFQFRFFKK